MRTTRLFGSMIAAVAGGMLVCTIPGGAVAGDVKTPAPATKALVKPGGETKIDTGTWTCRPAQHCVPSSVPGECISLKDGVNCSVSKGPAADR